MISRRIPGFSQPVTNVNIRISQWGVQLQLLVSQVKYRLSGSLLPRLADATDSEAAPAAVLLQSIIVLA